MLKNFMMPLIQTLLFPECAATLTKNYCRCNPEVGGANRKENVTPINSIQATFERAESSTMLRLPSVLPIS